MAVPSDGVFIVAAGAVPLDDKSIHITVFFGAVAVVDGAVAVADGAVAEVGMPVGH